MAKTIKAISTVSALLLIALVPGCATPKKGAQPVIEKDVSRVIKLADGTTCVEPAGLAQSRQLPGAAELSALIASDAKTDDILAKTKELKLKPEEVEAVYFDACRAYSKAAFKKEAFEKNRAVYLGLRQQLLAQGVKDWRDKKDGIAEAGKLCLVSLPDTDPEHRSFTRLVPADSTVGDCVHLAVANGSGEILLGCTKGHWENTWAKRSIAGVADGTKARNLSVKGTAYAPDPDCGWN